jgi:DNA-binding SARP family transcriptional activator
VVDVRLLGPLELSGEDGPIALSTPKLRTLFVVLALHPNDVVSEGRLIDALWGEVTPRTAEKTLQNHILRLRRVLRAGRSPVRIETQPGGYRLDVAPDELDVLVAGGLVAEARAAALAGDRSRAAARYRQAEDLWRGPSLDGFADEPFAVAEAARLDELRAACPHPGGHPVRCGWHDRRALRHGPHRRTRAQGVRRGPQPPPPRLPRAPRAAP